MKSAYELAMERLKADDPRDAPALSAEQKEKLAGLDRIYQAKIAERDIFLQGKLREARQKGDWGAAEDLQRQIGHEKARLEEERENKKNKIRQAG